MGKTDQGLQNSRQRYQTIPRVLIFLRNRNDILLLKGAPDKKIWANLYNGVGGHVENGEDVLAAAHREVEEETGLQVDSLSLQAVVNVRAGSDTLGIMMFVFTGWSSRRETIPSKEGALYWVPAGEIDGLPLVEDLSWLLPRILQRGDEEAPLFLHYSYDQADRLQIRQSQFQQ